MTTLNTWTPAIEGCKTWREAAAKPLHVREHRVEVTQYDLGEGPRVAIVIGLAIPFEGELPEGMVWMSEEFVAWVRAIVAQHAADLDAKDEALFQQVLKAEDAVRSDKVTAAFGANLIVRGDAVARMRTSKAKLFGLLDGMNPLTMARYGQWRKVQLGY